MKLMIPATVAATAAALVLAAGAVARQPAERPAEQVETVTVAPGSFAFRLPGEYLKADLPVDAPQRVVTFSSGFEMMKHQVSTAGYGRCVADGACEAADARRNVSGEMPVTGVSYRDAVAYAGWLSARTGQSWRLPTDEEWAFAAAERLKDDALGPRGDEDNPAARWLARYRAEAGPGARDTEPKPLGHFGLNSKNLADMAGNVWEWTTTCYVRARLARDGAVEQSTENCGVRVVAGSHRGYMSNFIRDGRSGGCAAGLAPDNLGIRLVRDRPSILAGIRKLWTRTM
ncbi:SUMF1/EgtB/PvdO family nonheme iron enzyme [Mesorhizobium sp. SP-1A]|uniref:SUMF1/EgtB/PvdO family nonheme iron enzyme n=1 Tax=Mesorhizobium sp. SP-1A TaxID=3077840 RepID=UPI0028F70FA4|nr:SUMF1/EgtB/PvdO family nonheme iron enzyme [Mesorhizobium sp. SP-1A]